MGTGRQRPRPFTAALALVLTLPLLAVVSASPAGAQDIEHEAYITSAYQGLLGRAPEPAGLTYWQGRLGAGDEPRAVLAAIGNSPEHRQHTVYEAYARFLDREAEPGGLQYWADALGDTLTLTALVGQLLASPEYYQRFGGGTDAGFVDAIYEDVFGRQPDPVGRQYWIDRIAAGAFRSTVATFLLRSAESVNLPGLSIVGSQPTPGALTRDLDRIVVTTDTSLVPEASALRVTVAGRPVQGTIARGDTNLALVFQRQEPLSWITPGTEVPVIVTIYGYDGSTIDRDDYSFRYRRPIAPVSDQFSTDTRETADFPTGGGDVAFLQYIRAAKQAGFERVLFEFSGADQLSYRVGYVEESIPPSGMPVDVAGPHQIEVTVSPGTAVDLSGSQPRETYTGPQRFSPPGTDMITEIVRVEDFEKVLVWAIGVDEQAPFAVRVLQNPLRLVIDIDS